MSAEFMAMTTTPARLRKIFSSWNITPSLRTVILRRPGRAGNGFKSRNHR